MIVIGQNEILKIGKCIQFAEHSSCVQNSTEIHADISAETIGFGDGVVQSLYEFVNLLDRHFRRAGSGLLAQRFFHVTEDIDVIDNDSTAFTGEYPVGSGDGLHQSVPFHRLIQIEC